MLKKINSNKGFTMIELLMVIMLVAILGAVALPQFLDFRTEGRVAATQSLVSSLRSGIKLQYSQQILRCSGVNGVWPTLDQVSNNDITEGDDPCTTSIITNESETRFLDQETIPANPFNGSTVVSACDATTAPCDDASTDSTYGWCYHASSGAFWAATNTRSECTF
jgi:prepilin-type N-terminal cleavage/methylation domain-containing protein